MTSWSLSAFLEKLSSDEPIPGGGSVAALAGALGAALVTMYCRIGMHQKTLTASAQEILLDIASKASQIQSGLAQMITEDSVAYGQVMSAFKLPKSTEEEKKQRQASIQDAFRKAVDVPMKTLQLCINCTSLIPQVSPCGNPAAFSDLKVAQYLCQAGANGAIENIEINLPYIKDEKYVSETTTTVGQLKRSLNDAVTQKIEKPS
jgi:formiminotetrahydrofolate cyclodeaminase